MSAANGHHPRRGGRAHLVTGATGLVGGAIVLQLLEATRHDVVHCVVRGDSQAHATSRLQGTLTEAARMYGQPHLAGEVARRCFALRGDITVAGCGVAEPPPVDEMWHCAASLKYRDSERFEVELQNVTGTENAVALATRLGVEVLNHCSTAYVAGDRTGRVFEVPVAPDARPNNVYEASKIRAEGIAESAGVRRLRILRPSVVIGHSGTLEASTWSGMYGFANEMLRFKSRVERKLGTYLEHYAVAILADPQVRINLVPVDVVARAAARISIADAPAGVYHLANTAPPRVGDGLAALTRVLAMRTPRYVTDPAALTTIDRKLNDGMEFHRSYMLQDKELDCSATERVCGPDSLHAPLGQEQLEAHLDHYLYERLPPLGTIQRALPVRRLAGGAAAVAER